jgi:hypothetical protein
MTLFSSSITDGKSTLQNAHKEPDQAEFEHSNLTVWEAYLNAANINITYKSLQEGVRSHPHDNFVNASQAALQVN